LHGQLIDSSFKKRYEHILNPALHLVNDFREKDRNFFLTALKNAPAVSEHHIIKYDKIANGSPQENTGFVGKIIQRIG
jgi:hypothetical protein